MQSVQVGQQRQQGRKASGEIFTSFETTGDEEHKQAIIKLDLLEQHHRTLSSHYMAKLREMAETVKRQTEVKEKLTRQIHCLAQESQQQQDHLCILSTRLQQTLQQERSREHLNMVSSAYLLPQPAQQPQKKGRNVRGTLFVSEKLKTPQGKGCRSEARRENEYLLFKSPQGVRRRGKGRGSQSQRVQN